MPVPMPSFIGKPFVCDDKRHLVTVAKAIDVTDVMAPRPGGKIRIEYAKVEDRLHVTLVVYTVHDANEGVYVSLPLSSLCTTNCKVARKKIRTLATLFGLKSSELVQLILIHQPDG